MSQTTVSLDNALAVPGQIADVLGPRDVVTAVAYEDIPAGRIVALRSDGTVELPDDDSANLYGVALYQDTLEASLPVGDPTHKAGRPLPIMRMGKVWLSFSGGDKTKDGVANIHNDDADSTALAKRGMVTGSATSSNSIRAGTGLVEFEHTRGGSTLACVKVNFGL